MKVRPPPKQSPPRTAASLDEVLSDLREKVTEELAKEMSATDQEELTQWREWKRQHWNDERGMTHSEYRMSKTIASLGARLAIVESEPETEEFEVSTDLDSVISDEFGSSTVDASGSEAEETPAFESWKSRELQLELETLEAEKKTLKHDLDMANDDLDEAIKQLAEATNELEKWREWRRENWDDDHSMTCGELKAREQMEEITKLVIKLQGKS